MWGLPPTDNTDNTTNVYWQGGSLYHTILIASALSTPDLIKFGSSFASKLVFL
jgi:hypothetical protein